MNPPAEFIRDSYKGSGKVALVSDGDSGIGRAAAVHSPARARVSLIVR